MILRAYYLAALLWAAMILASCVRHADEWPYWALAFGPFAVPFAIRLAAAWILHGPDAFLLRTVRRKP
jgi:hypothetical protein